MKTLKVGDKVKVFTVERRLSGISNMFNPLEIVGLVSTVDYNGLVMIYNKWYHPNSVELLAREGSSDDSSTDDKYSNIDG